jgi:acyl carrier protein
VVIAPRGIAALPAGAAPPQSYSAPQAVHDRPELSVPFAPPRNDLERGLAAIWREVLGIAGIGIHDNFFELGGDSLLATQVIPRMRDKLGVQAPPAILFEQPTIAELAASLGQTTSALAAAAGAGREEGYL